MARRPRNRIGRSAPEPAGIAMRTLRLFPTALKVGQGAVSYIPHGSLLTGDAEHIRESRAHSPGGEQASTAERHSSHDESREDQRRSEMPERLPVS
ncbi:hypothetical protein SAMN05446635_7478 [Burkholderia sp. OK233]|nr:hypothetical protein SAMN05446635_7478 [Burkholderia sp. OK233]